MRKNISLSQNVEDRAQAIIKARGFDGLSDLIAALVREEYERRTPPVLNDGVATPPPSGNSPSEPVTYSKKPTRKRKTNSKVAAAGQAIADAIDSEAQAPQNNQPKP